MEISTYSRPTVSELDVDLGTFRRLFEPVLVGTPGQLDRQVGVGQDLLEAGPEPVADPPGAVLRRDEAAVDRASAVVAAENRSRRVSHRFRTSFEEILTDADLTIRLTGGAHEDGLEEATEGAEVDVEF